jgi:hypothetical protein
MAEGKQKEMSAGASLLLVLLIALVGATAFFVVFERFGANGYLSAGIFLAILAVSAVAETVRR